MKSHARQSQSAQPESLASATRVASLDVEDTSTRPFGLRNAARNQSISTLTLDSGGRLRHPIPFNALPPKAWKLSSAGAACIMAGVLAMAGSSDLQASKLPSPDSVRAISAAHQMDVASQLAPFQIYNPKFQKNPNFLVDTKEGLQVGQKVIMDGFDPALLSLFPHWDLLDQKTGNLGFVDPATGRHLIAIPLDFNAFEVERLPDVPADQRKPWADTTTAKTTVTTVLTGDTSQTLVLDIK